jgi:hypothetical protein
VAQENQHMIGLFSGPEWLVVHGQLRCVMKADSWDDSQSKKGLHYI